MIIDFHTHVFPERIAEKTVSMLEKIGNLPAFANGTEKCLSDSLSSAGATLAVNLPVLTKPSQFDSVLDFAIELNKKLYFMDCDNKQYENLENKINSMVEYMEESFIDNINCITEVDINELEEFFIECYLESIDIEDYYYNTDTMELVKEVHYIKSYM